MKRAGLQDGHARVNQRRLGRRPFKRTVGSYALLCAAWHQERLHPGVDKPRFNELELADLRAWAKARNFL
jgi:hypothetical protein